MKDLTVGGPQKHHFAAPSPVDGKSDGWVWMGRRAMTAEDKEQFFQFLKTNGHAGSIDDVKVDPRSVGGLLDPNWSSYYYEHNAKAKRPGGRGSKVFEAQKVGPGVNFAKKKIWYTDKDGQMHHGIPPNAGAYHYENLEDGEREAVEGPKPGSKADQKLKGGRYEFDEAAGYYVIVH